MFTAILVDDEENARLLLRSMIGSYFPEIKILGEASNVPDSVKLIHKEKPDVVFLDIEMPGYTGLDLVNFFNRDEKDFKIVFVTAYSEFAVNAFEQEAYDYLLKPVKKEQLEKTIKKMNVRKYTYFFVVYRQIKCHEFCRNIENSL